MKFKGATSVKTRITTILTTFVSVSQTIVGNHIAEGVFYRVDISIMIVTSNMRIQ
jgi:hypothetical protein